jgi:hypothetical protein
LRYTGSLANVYFWRNYQQQEIDWFEYENGELRAFEIKFYASKKVKTPSGFRQNYPGVEVLQIDRDIISGVYCLKRIYAGSPITLHPLPKLLLRNLPLSDLLGPEFNLLAVIFVGYLMQPGIELIVNAYLRILLGNQILLSINPNPLPKYQLPRIRSFSAFISASLG